MPRSSLLLVAAALAAGAIGCAHCDTCDDFPAPCTGPNCGYAGFGSGPFGPPEVMAPGAVVQPPQTTTPAPAPDAGAETNPAPTTTPNPLPEMDGAVPGDSPPAAESAPPAKP